jgi:two-component sensor histidine kinase/PAS domain-containing protein
MAIIRDICRKTTALTASQIEDVAAITNVLEIAADLAHGQITVYTRAINKNFLVIIAQARPNTSFIQPRPSLLGATVHASEEPLVWRTMTTGEQISGKREWALGMDVLEMRTFPIYDGAGTIIGVVSFEANGDEVWAGDNSALLDTAYMLLTSDKHASGTVYRPLTVRDGILIADDHGQIVFANATAISIYKVLGVNQIVGKRIYQERQIYMRLAQKAVVSGQPYETEVELSTMLLSQRVIPISAKGQTIRTIILVTDITELRKKEKELLVKAAVIQEIHHRVKNNLQTIASLLRLQARRSKSNEVKAALGESVNRILSISVVHEFLSQQDAEIINVAEVTKNILDLVIQNMLEPGFNIQTVFNGQTVILPSDQAANLALVINELISNALEHAFIGRHEGLIGVDVSVQKEHYKIEIYDNGVGLPPDFTESKSLGLQIVRTLVETDLGGQFKLYTKDGTHACITIPKETEGG